ncbi:MAG: hypothetical protein AAGG57_15915 [Pseudomonadota bacterium]
MTQDLTWLLTLDRFAKRFGDGLKPELEKLLREREEQVQMGAIPIPVVEVSSGPKHQFATPQQLKESGIPVLRAIQKPSEEPRDGKGSGTGRIG